MSETSLETNDNKKFSFDWFIIFIVAQIIFVVIIFFFVKQFCNDMFSLNEKNLQMNKTLIEQIEIAPIKDKTGKISFNMNTDEMKKTVNIGYTENHSKFMQAYYETQSNWLNFWMTLLAIILAAFGLIIPLSFMKLYEIKAKELELKHNILLENFELKATKTEDGIQKRIEKSEGRITKIQEIIEGIEVKVNKQVDRAEESAKQPKESEELAKAHKFFNEALNSKDLNEQIIKYGEVIALCKKLNDDKGASLAYNNRGLSYYNQGNYDDAIKDYNTAIELNPDYFITRFNRGNAYSTTKEYDKAILDYTHAILKDNDFMSAYYNRGISYLEIKQYEKAIEDFKKSLLINSKESTPYLNLSEAYLELKNYKEAEKNLSLAKKYVKGEDENIKESIKNLEERLEKERPKD